MMRGWTRLYGLSIKLGARDFFRHGFSRAAAIRVLVPIEPSRFIEFPETLRALSARPGERVLDLASPKLLGADLASRGVEVVSVDVLESEVEDWQRLTSHIELQTVQVADGTALPFADASFDHAYSVSVLEHIPDEGDLDALRELARVVRPGGRVVLTLPLSSEYSEDWRGAPVYSDDAPNRGRFFFARCYDRARLEGLCAAAPTLELSEERMASLAPQWVARAYERFLPWTSALTPLLGVVLRKRDEEEGGTTRLTLVRR